jgi:hypothetical protein
LLILTLENNTANHSSSKDSLLKSSRIRANPMEAYVSRINYGALSLLLSIGLFVAMVFLTLSGHRYGRRRIVVFGEATGQDVVAVEGAIFALLGLLIAFTFTTAYSRLDARRDLIVQEVNAIGTAYLRLGLLPIEDQPALRIGFREYVDSRIQMWRKLKDIPAALEEIALSVKLQNEIWSQAVIASEGNQAARMLLLPALNEMIDITTTRLSKIISHPPPLVYVTLFTLALLSAWLVGNSMAKSPVLSWPHVIGFAAMIAFAVYVILDTEFLRYGLVRLDTAYELLTEVRKSMN